MREEAEAEVEEAAVLYLLMCFVWVAGLSAVSSCDQHAPSIQKNDSSTHHGVEGDESEVRKKDAEVQNATDDNVHHRAARQC